MHVHNSCFLSIDDIIVGLLVGNGRILETLHGTLLAKSVPQSHGISA